MAPDRKASELISRVNSYKEKGKILKISVLELIWKTSGSRIVTKHFNIYLKGESYGRF